MTGRLVPFAVSHNRAASTVTIRVSRCAQPPFCAVARTASTHLADDASVPPWLAKLTSLSISGMPPQHAGRRSEAWTVEEVLTQVALDGDDAVSLARAVVVWAERHYPYLRIRGGTGWTDRSLTIYAGLGRGRGVLSLYAAGNGGSPKLEIQIDHMCSMADNYAVARSGLLASLRAIGIPRLDEGDVLTMVRPNIPLADLSRGRLEFLLSVVDGWLEEIH
jgi:hypothetical protein